MLVLARDTRAIRSTTTTMVRTVFVSCSGGLSLGITEFTNLTLPCFNIDFNHCKKSISLACGITCRTTKTTEA